jgi:hypothetical protein
MLAATVGGVALLLSGRSVETQVCRETLEQRSVAVWRVGSLPVGSPTIQPVEGWPGPADAGLIPRDLLTPPGDPAAFNEAAGNAPASRRWVTTTRSLPFALVTSIDNRQAWIPQDAAVIDALLIASTVLDPADDADRALLAAFRRAVNEGEVPEEERAKLRRRRQLPDPTAGEARARAFLDDVIGLVGRDDVRAAVREAIAASLPEPG